MKRPLAYITAPWSENEFENTENAAKYCRAVYDAGFSPVCPTLFLPLFLRDEIPQEHKRVHHHGANGLVSGIINGTAIFGSQLHVVLGAVAPMGGNVSKRSFHVFSSFLPTSGHRKSSRYGLR